MLDLYLGNLPQVNLGNDEIGIKNNIELKKFYFPEIGKCKIRFFFPVDFCKIRIYKKIANKFWYEHNHFYTNFHSNFAKVY